MKKQKPKKAIFFDFDNTLADWDATDGIVTKQLATFMKKKYGVPEDTFVSAMHKVHHGVKGKSFNDVYERAVWFQKIAVDTGLSLSSKDIQALCALYWKLVYKNITLFPHAKEVLRRARKKYLLCLVTDSDGKTDVTKQGKIRAVGIKRFFDVIITSNMVKANKPSKKMWLRALRALSVSPKNCIMVGDKPYTDLAPAKKVGMHTIWVRIVQERHKQPLCYYDFVDRIITDLREIL